MEKILAKRYAFCDFSDIAGFPHPVPTINEWGDYLPRFRGSRYDHPGEHLFNFHECMLEHGFVHEDVLIKLFKFSLEGNAREWCQSLPAVSIHSLKDFHVAFNSYYEKIYPADLLFPECCHDQEDLISPFENLKNDDQIDKLESETVEIEEDHEGSLQVQGLQRLEICSRREEEQKELDQLYIMHVSLIEDEQFVVDMEIGGSHQQQHVNLQLEQLLKEVFHSDFYDPITDFLESMSGINIKTFLSDKEQSCFCYRLYFCMIWFPSFVGLRSRSISGNHFLTWLHWKHDFT
jgi:hypothetical protein